MQNGAPENRIGGSMAHPDAPGHRLDSHGVGSEPGTWILGVATCHF